MTDFYFIQYCAKTQEIINQTQDAINQMQNSVNRMMEPITSDEDLLPQLHDMMQHRLKGERARTAIRVELFVLLALYSPERLYDRGGNKRHGNNRSAIEHVLGLSKYGATRYKKYLLGQLFIYKSFRKLVQECYDMCKEYVLMQKTC